MAEYYVNSSDVVLLADAIRSKAGTSASMSFPGGFVSTVEAIPAASGMTVDEFIQNYATISEYSGDVTAIGEGAFAFCRNLTSVNFPNCTTIGSSAFNSCRALATMSFPKCTMISSRAFCSCNGLKIVSFPSCTTILDSAFHYCSGLTTASFPMCTSIGGYAFCYCTSLTTVSFPMCASIGRYAFASYTKLTTASFPMCASIGSYAFYTCTSLTMASFPNCTTIGEKAFSQCTQLISLYLLGSSIVDLGYSNAFASTPIDGYTVSTSGIYGSIFVPSSLYESYKSATNWTYFSDRFVSV